MTVYKCPEAVQFVHTDWCNLDVKVEQNRILNHKASLLTWLQSNGYKGKLTGEVVRFSVADGYAEYMVADKGRSCDLIHLPYWDAYQLPYAHRLTRKDIIQAIEVEKAFNNALKNQGDR